VTKTILATLVAALAFAASAEAQSIWDTVPIPRIAPITRAPELTVFDFRYSYLALLPEPAKVNGSIWPDAALAALPFATVRTASVCVATSPYAAQCYVIAPMKD